MARVGRLFPAVFFLVFLCAHVADASVSITDEKALKQQQKRQAKNEAIVQAGGKPRSPGVTSATGAQTLIDSGGLKYFINTHITFSTTSSASGANSEASYTQAVNADTLNGGVVSATLNDAFDGYNTMCLSLNNTVANCATGNGNFVFYNKNAPAATSCLGPVSSVNRQVVFPVQTSGNIQMQRKVFVPDNDQFIRHLNTFTNTGGSPQTVTMVVANNLGSDSNTKITASSSGALGSLTSTAVTWVASFQNWSGTTSDDVRLGFVLQQPSVAVSLSGLNFVDGDDNPFWGYTFTIPAGGTVSIANFNTGQPTRALAASKASALASGTNPNQWNCLTTQERANIRNFAAEPVAPAIAVPSLQQGVLALLALLALLTGAWFIRRRGASH